MESSFNQKSTSNGSWSSEEDVENIEKPIFVIEGLSYVKTLSQSKFPVYVVYSSRLDKYCVMKVFLWEGEIINEYYVRESRISNLSHPNLITIFHTEDKEFFNYEDQTRIGSYILMEYAQYGDFLMAITKYQIPFHDKLLRTYFHQLIAGLEFLHTHKVAHLDIKPDNILFVDDYTLKLTDFDLSCMEKDMEVESRGTKNYRAPEVCNGICTDPRAADIYSAGILLFFLKARTLPYCEEPKKGKVDMAVLKEDHPETFWENHCRFGDHSSSFFSADFKSLFIEMTHFDPEARSKLADIKGSNWYRGEVYTNEELCEFMKGRFDS